MPYKRVGKCIYKELTNGKLSKDPVGCSDSIEKAEKYLKALYASEVKENINEELSPEVSQKAKIIFKSIINSRGDKLFNKMGLEAEQYAYATAINQAKRALNKPETPEDMNQDDTLKEMVKAALTKSVDEKKSFPDLTGDGKITRADILKARGVDLAEDNDEVIDFKEYSKSRELSEDDWKQSDDESDMAKGQLLDLIHTANALEELIKDGTQLDAWVQAKLTKAQDYIASVYQYMKGEEEQKNDKLPVVIDLTQKVMERLKTK
jgi:hypothetical protein